MKPNITHGTFSCGGKWITSMNAILLYITSDFGIIIKKPEHSLFFVGNKTKNIRHVTPPDILLRENRKHSNEQCLCIQNR